MPRLVRSVLRRFTPAVIGLVFVLALAAPAWAAVTANDDAAIAAEDIAIDIAVLANDLTDGSPLVITGVSAPSSGTAVIVGSLIRYQPLPNFAGADTFTYDIGADGFADTATVYVTVIASNDAPIAVADFGATPEEAALVIPVLANDSDPDGDPVSLLSAGTPSFGSAIVDGPTITYTPDLNYTGPDLFTYNVSDGVGGVATGVVSITVTPLNDPPTAVDDAAGTFRDTPVVVAATVNDGDVDGDAISVSAVGTPASGAAAVVGPGSIEYTPDPGFVGIDTFSYTVTDPSGAIDSASVTVTVSATNRPPEAVDDFAATDPETPVAIDVLANDSDPDGDALSLLTVGAPARGIAVLNGDGTVTYTPGAGFAGLDAFAYTAGDSGGGTDSGMVTVSVAPAAGAPVVNPDVAVVPEDGAVDIDVLANDVSDSTLAVQSVGNAAHGTVALQADGSVRYSPVADYYGPDGFTYVATDLEGVSASALVSITVTAVNDPPIAVADGSRSEGGAPTELNVLANDSDPEDDPLTAVLLTEPSQGSVTLLDGIVRYEPSPGFVGIDSFRYEVCDQELCDSALVTIEVTAPPPLPPVDAPIPVADLPQLSTETASPPLNAKPAISPSIGLSLASSASLESLGVLMLPLTLLGVVMVWVLSANNFPFLFFWRRKRKKEEAPPIG